MAKFYGVIGFIDTVEQRAGVWVEEVIERNYYGDVIRDTLRLQSSTHLNDNVNVSNQISIVSDPYANQNFHAMRYIEFMGTRWKITDVEVKHPRLILSIGGLYNNEQ